MCLIKYLFPLIEEIPTALHQFILHLFALQ